MAQRPDDGLKRDRINELERTKVYHNGTWTCHIAELAFAAQTTRTESQREMGLTLWQRQASSKETTRRAFRERRGTESMCLSTSFTYAKYSQSSLFSFVAGAHKAARPLLHRRLCDAGQGGGGCRGPPLRKPW